MRKLFVAALAVGWHAPECGGTASLNAPSTLDEAGAAAQHLSAGAGDSDLDQPLLTVCVDSSPNPEWQSNEVGLSALRHPAV